MMQVTDSGGVLPVPASPLNDRASWAAKTWTVRAVVAGVNDCRGPAQGLQDSVHVVGEGNIGGRSRRRYGRGKPDRLPQPVDYCCRVTPPGSRLRRGGRRRCSPHVRRAWATRPALWDGGRNRPASAAGSRRSRRRPAVVAPGGCRCVDPGTVGRRLSEADSTGPGAADRPPPFRERSAVLQHSVHEARGYGAGERSSVLVNLLFTRHISHSVDREPLDPVGVGRRGDTGGLHLPELRVLGLWMTEISEIPA